MHDALVQQAWDFATPDSVPAGAADRAPATQGRPPATDRRQQLLASLREFATARGRTDSPSEFLQATGIHEAELKEHFLSWGEFEVAAGVVRITPEHRDDHTLLLDLHRVALDLGRFPTRSEYHWLRRYGFNTIKRRFGLKWAAVEKRYAAWLAAHHPLHPLLASLPAPAAAGTPAGPAAAPRAAAARTTRRDEGPPLVGRPWSHPAMPFEPINELGVILLFGHAAPLLGFAVESISSLRDPDCTAYRAVNGARSQWRRVRIEFEFASRSFRDHGHDRRACDLIVCWEHNWPDCPIPVLELRSVLPPLLAKTA